MEYPERTKRIKMLRLLLEELRKAFARGSANMSIHVHYQTQRLGGIFREYRPYKVLDVMSLADTIRDDTAWSSTHIHEILGLSAAETYNLLDTLVRGGYINAERSGQAGHAFFYVRSLTDKGLREIGELPDPQAQLIQGFDAAIEAIKRDSSLPEAEKKRKIDWLEEGKIVARTLTIDAIKAILAGAIP